MRSNYIVIEGLEGAGKTTARNLVVETLKQLGISDMVFTREPGGTIGREAAQLWCWIYSPPAMKLSMIKPKY